MRAWPRCVFVSSCAVHEVILADRPLDETHRCGPTILTGLTRRRGSVCPQLRARTGWPICALRPTGIYGLPIRHRPVVGSTRWAGAAWGARRDGEGRQGMHAVDVARAIELLPHRDTKPIAGQAFNCYDRYVSEEQVRASPRS